MSLSLRLDELRAEAQRRGDYYPPQIQPVEMDAYINGSIRQYYNIITAIDPSRYQTNSPATIAVIAGTESYALPADFYKPVLFLVPDPQSSTGFAPSELIEWSDRHRHGRVASVQQLAMHAIANERIYIWPPPDWSGNCQLDYIPIVTELKADDDTFAFSQGGEEWVILDTLIKCAGKIRDDESVWERQRRSVEKRIIDERLHNQSGVRYIIDTRRLHRRRYRWR